MSLLFGAAAGALATVVTGRSTARKTDTETRTMDAKLPAEVDSVVVQGAEQAVITMAKALESANQRIEELVAARVQDALERAADRAEMVRLQARVDELEAKVDLAEAATREARDASRQLSEELRRVTAAHDQRENK